MISIAIITTLLFITACSSNNDTATVSNGKYIMKQEKMDTVFSPYVNITDGNFTFSYDLLSSYLPYGTYSIEGKILTLTTSDKKFQYVFKITGDKLIFKEKESSSVKLIDSRLGVEISDKAVFKLDKN